MRSVIRLPFIAACVALAALPVATGPASAGGPTSVLVVNPSTEATASLYTSEASYTRLLDALKPARDDVAGEDVPVDLRGGPGSSAINVTWLVHDVSVWRVDRVQIDGRGDPWVQTAESLADRVLWNGKAPWRRPAEPDRLLTILVQLGVLGGEPAIDREIATSHGSNNDAGPSEATSSWWWLLPGAAVGVAIGALGRPYAAAMLTHHRKSGPRQQLIDA